VPLLIAWFTAFAAEVHDRGRHVDQSAAVHERRIGYRAVEDRVVLAFTTE
jgi:hypothetical protein